MYQKKTKDPRKYKIYVEDPTSREDQWMWGVFFYNLAYPLSLTCLILYCFPEALWNKKFSAHAQTLRQDTERYLMIKNYFLYYTYQSDLLNQDQKTNDEDWRSKAMVVLTIIPAAFLVFDSIFNKIKLPGRHVGYLIIVIIMFISITLIGQALQGGVPIYYTNTNWNLEPGTNPINPAFSFSLPKKEMTCSDYKNLESVPTILKSFTTISECLD